jgi:hypothetical protein
MNSPVMQNQLSLSSFSNNHSNSNVLFDEVSEEKSISIATPKHRNDISTSNKSLLGNESHQHIIPKCVDVDLKQQLSLKMTISATTSTPTSSVSLSTATDTCKSVHHNDESSTTRKEHLLKHKSSSVRSNDSISATTASTAMTSLSSSLSTSSNNCNTATTIKKVHFATDRKGQLVCKLHRNREPKTKHEMVDCFYQMKDFQQFRRECKQEAILQQRTTTYRDNFAAVYAACTNGNFKNVTRERAYISAATCRGLEVVVFPTLHIDRKNLIMTVLKTQSSIPQDMSHNERMEAIASTSRYLSKQARQLARVFGSGDAAVVIANQRIESIQQKQEYEEVEKQVPVVANHNISDTDDSTDESKERIQQSLRQSRRSSKSKIVDVKHCFVSC